MCFVPPDFCKPDALFSSAGGHTFGKYCFLLAFMEKHGKMGINRLLGRDRTGKQQSVCAKVVIRTDGRGMLHERKRTDNGRTIHSRGL